MPRTLVFMLIGAALMLVAVTGQATEGEKQRIAVLDFDFSEVEHWWGTDWNLGRSISDVIATKLNDNDAFEVIDRATVERAFVGEGTTRRFVMNPEAIADFGRKVGADVVLVGRVSQFGNEKEADDDGGGGLLGKANDLFGAVKDSKEMTRCVIDAQLIDVETGETVSSAVGEGFSADRNELLGAAVKGALSSDDRSLPESIAGEAIDVACDSVVTQIVIPERVEPSTIVAIDGLVADYDASAGEITITPGKEAGINVGHVLLISRVSGVVKHPVTGEVLREKTSDVCRIEVTMVGDGYAVGVPLSDGKPEIGDKVSMPRD